MPANMGNDTCALCHTATPGGLSVRDAHTHPVLNPAYNPGLVFALSPPVEAPGFSNGNGVIDVGERVRVTFTIKDESGADVAPSALASTTVVVTGPTSNYNFLLNTSLPTAFMAPAASYTMNLPAPVTLERVGANTGGLDTWNTSLAPVWGSSPTVHSLTLYARTGSGLATTTTSATGAQDNFLDVASTAGYAQNTYLVVDDG